MPISGSQFSTARNFPNPFIFLIRQSAAKKAVWRTSVLFTATANLPFSTPHIAIITGPISIKFIYFMPSIYVTLHPKFKRN